MISVDTFHIFSGCSKKAPIKDMYHVSFGIKNAQPGYVPKAN